MKALFKLLSRCFLEVPPNVVCAYLRHRLSTPTGEHKHLRRKPLLIAGDTPLGHQLGHRHSATNSATGGQGRVPRHVEKEKWRILPVGEVHDQPAALAGGPRRNAPWARVSGKMRGRRSLSPSR